MSEKVQIQCRLRAFKGKTLNVGDEQVTVGDDLRVSLKPENAARLLAGKNWQEEMIDTKKVKARGTIPAAPAAKGRPVRRGDSTDDPTLSDTVEPPKTEAPPPPPGAEAGGDPVVSDEFDTSSPQGKYAASVLESVCESYDVEAEDVLTEAFAIDQAGDKNGYFKEAELALAASKLTDKPVDAEGNLIEEWPYADESMPLDYIKRIADAYQVSYAANIGASTLVGRVNDAMAPDEE